MQNLVYNMYSLDLSKKISSALQTRTRNGTRLPVNARYGYKKGKDGRLEVDPEAAKVVKMIFRMAAEGTSFADITRELNRQAIATCDEQKLSRGDQVQFQRFDTIKKKHWSPTTVAAIVRDEIYIGTSFADITRELNRQAIATCDEQKLSRGDQVQFQRFDTIKKKHWSPTTVSAIVRDEIYIGTRIWGKTRCSKRGSGAVPEV